jgi:hypothetical protein
MSAIYRRIVALPIASCDPQEIPPENATARTQGCMLVSRNPTKQKLYSPLFLDLTDKNEFCFTN